MIDLFIGLFFGVMIASYTSSIFYRLPRGISLFGYSEKGGKPFCSKCMHPLKPWEYYSVISWIYCMGKCSYCSQKIDIRYIILESGVIISSALFAYLYGIGDLYFLYLMQGIIFWIILMMASNNTQSNSLYAAGIMVAVLYNVMISGSITSWAYILVLNFIYAAPLYCLIFRFIGRISLNNIMLSVDLSLWCLGDINKLIIANIICLLLGVVRTKNKDFVYILAIMSFWYVW